MNYQHGDHWRPPEIWTLTLNQYQRDNLLWLLQCVGGWPWQEAKERQVAPFSYANSGDWVGEIAGMLGTEDWIDGKRVPKFNPKNPNCSVEQLRVLVNHWREQNGL